MNAADSPLLQRLFSLHRFGIRPGLERIEYLVKLLGNPQNTYPVIHVAGTNGKGSVSSMLASVFASAGYRVGLYTSPHIRRFNERIRVNGTEIPDDDIARIVAPLLAEAEKEHTTFFEITTATAFRYFAEQHVDIAVIETGMGGRLDATNIVQPLASVITSIDFDHSEYLGSTLEAIAGEKAGIIKPNAPVILGERREKLWGVFADKAASMGSPVVIVPRFYYTQPLEFRPDFSMNLHLETPSQNYEVVECGLAGRSQAGNIATVVATLHAVAEKLPVEEQHLREGLRLVRKNAGLHGRIELLRGFPPLVLDVGHNPACMRHLARTLHDCGYGATRWTTVFGVMADKETGEMLETIAGFSRRIITAAAHTGRAMHAEELAERARNAGIFYVTAAQTVAEAVRIALETGEPLLITGSFYVADEALEYLEKNGLLRF